MPVKVSVIVPVYNPGTYIEDCVSSLRRQSLPPEEYEAIFVDDGSTDGTPARLDRLAAEDPRMRVIHQENSGWSGKPRNVGIAAARGEFVMFVDNDDYLGVEALERMYAYGVANGADVVVGKMAGKNRSVPVELFRRNHPRATVENAPLIDSLTPHKMFRRAFLDEIGLVPEGRRRLEDHVFVTEAYLRAAQRLRPQRLRLLLPHPARRRLQRRFQRFDPVAASPTSARRSTWSSATRSPARCVTDCSAAGCGWRWWTLAKRLLGLPDDYRRELFGEIHKVVVERFGPAVAAGLQPTQQVVASLTAADRYDDVVALAGGGGGRAGRGARRGVGGRLAAPRLHRRIRLGGAPRRSRRCRPCPADRSPKNVEEAVAWIGTETVARFDQATADLLLRERASSGQYFQPVEFTRETVAVDGGERVRLMLRATATVDPAVLPGDGAWDAVVRLKLGGWTGVRLGPAPRATRRNRRGVTAGRAVLPYWTEPHGNLSLDVGVKGRRLGLGQVRRPDVSVSGARLHARIPLHTADGTAVRLRFTSAGRTL
ncbi:glycosyltransferase family 2 protein [Streptomyces hirsutus]